jgi:hypothetical protein
MTVIVNHRRVADLFDIQIRTLDAERPDATAKVINPVGMGADRSKRRHDILDRKAGCHGLGRRDGARRGGATTKAHQAAQSERAFH